MSKGTGTGPHGARSGSSTRSGVMAGLLLAAGLLLGATAAALPEDAQQPMELDWNDVEYGLDDGLIIMYGSDAEPASIRQGSMLITGTEIRIERNAEGVTRVVATGRPARFAQQLEAGQDPLRASGLTMVFDNPGQTLTIDEQVEVQHLGVQTQTHHFEYNLATRRFRSSRDPDGEQARIVVPPATPDGQP